MAETIAFEKADAALRAKCREAVGRIIEVFTEMDLTPNETSCALTELLSNLTVEFFPPENRECFVNGFCAGMLKTLRTNGMVQYKN